MKQKLKQSSIVRKLTWLILGIIILQTILYGVILIRGGVLKQAELNAYQLFHDKVRSRKDYVQREMKNKWINYNPYLMNIKKLLHEKRGEAGYFDHDILNELIAMLRATQATGAYVILVPDGEMKEDLPALYIRDYDPIMNATGNDDLYMVMGPASLSTDFQIPLDQIWRHNFRKNAGNADFIEKPYKSTEITSKATLLGYWSKPFKIDEGDVDIITYSMPLFDQLGELRGIIGIDVTLNYLKDYFPATELQPQDSLGYLIAYKDGQNDALTPVMMGGPLQKRMIQEGTKLDLSMANEEMSIFKIENHLGVEELYAAVEKIGLYQFNTPFENEEWYLIGIMREDYLLSYANQIKQTLWMSLIMALVLGSLGGIFTSYHMTRPIVALVNQLKLKTPEQALKLQRTGYLELDELANAVEVANELMLESASRLSKVVSMFEWPIGAYEVKPKDGRYFVTDNFFKILGQEQLYDTPEMTYKAFVETLQNILSKLEPGEDDVFIIDSDPVRWIRINSLQTETSEIGAIVDVTDEMLEKKQMRHERDHDPLTQLLNRKGFQWAFEKWYNGSPTGVSALVMFDLDNLKRVNDKYGHKWGDRYIVGAVKHLNEVVSDKSGIVGRRSGDEFVLLLYGAKSKEDIRRRLQAFYDRLKANPIEFPDHTYKEIEISGGLMWIESKVFSYDEILHFADEALYVAKRGGKGTYIESTWT